MALRHLQTPTEQRVLSSTLESAVAESLRYAKYLNAERSKYSTDLVSGRWEYISTQLQSVMELIRDINDANYLIVTGQDWM